jgi:hypothetical protein
MCFVVSLVPATVWLIIGYFVLFAASRSDRGIRVFGQVLAVWIFVIAVVIPLAGAYVTLAGLCPLEDMLTTMHPAGPGPAQ